MVEFVLDGVENTVEKGEIAGLPAISPFPTMFSKGFSATVFIAGGPLPQLSLRKFIQHYQTLVVCLGFYAISTVFKLFNSDSS